MHCLQDPWIQNSTVRNNLLMGKPYDEEDYITVLAACALGHDLELLTAGDSTEIGERACNRRVPAFAWMQDHTL